MATRIAYRPLENDPETVPAFSDPQRMAAEDWDDLRNATELAVKGINTAQVEVGGFVMLSDAFEVISLGMFPDADAVRDIGTGALRWDDVYAVTYHGDGSLLTGVLGLAGGTMTGTLNMGGFGIVNMLDPSGAQDAATKAYVDGKSFVNLQGATPGSADTGNFHVSGTGILTNLILDSTNQDIRLTRNASFGTLGVTLDLDNGAGGARAVRFLGPAAFASANGSIWYSGTAQWLQAIGTSAVQLRFRSDGEWGFGNSAALSSATFDARMGRTSTGNLSARDESANPIAIRTATELIDKVSSDTLTLAESGCLFTNEGATAIVVLTLPSSATEGATFGARVVDDDGIRFLAPTGITIRVGTGQSAAAGKIESTQVGAVLWLTYDSSASEWVADRQLGTWTIDSGSTDLVTHNGDVAIPLGEIYLTTATTVTVSDTTSWFAVDNATNTALTALSRLFDTPGNTRLRYTGSKPSLLHIACSLSVSCGSANQDIQVAISKNGTVITPSIQILTLGTAGDVANPVMHAFIDVVTNDYLEVEIKNTTAANDVTAETLNLFVMAMPDANA